MMDDPFYVKAVLFDFDGTLTKPGSIDFNLIKRVIGCPAESFILEFIETLHLKTLKPRRQTVQNPTMAQKSCCYICDQMA